MLVDDTPTYACSVLTHSMKAKRIETVEGLEAPSSSPPSMTLMALVMGVLGSRVLARRRRPTL